MSLSSEKLVLHCSMEICDKLEIVNKLFIYIVLPAKQPLSRISKLKARTLPTFGTLITIRIFFDEDSHILLDYFSETKIAGIQCGGE